MRKRGSLAFIGLTLSINSDNLIIDTTYCTEAANSPASVFFCLEVVFSLGRPSSAASKSGMQPYVSKLLIACHYVVA